MNARSTFCGLLLLLCVISIDVTANTNQGNFRWRNDDGSETSATWRQSQNTNDSLAGINNIRLRIELYNSDPSNPNFGPVVALFYSADNSTYTQVTTDGSLNHWKLNTSGNFADGDATTNQLSTSYTFAAGNIYESSTTFSASIGAASSEEYEFCISPTQNTVSGTTYYFRILNSAGGSIEGYGTTPTLYYVLLASAGSATAIGVTGATLNGSVHPQGLSTTAYFLYGTSSGTYTDSVEADQSPLSDASSTSVSKTLSGLTAGTTYYYRVAKDNTNGYARSNEQSFTTSASEPTTVSSAASISDAGNFSKTLRWTNGNGSSHIVVMKRSSAVDADPVDGTSYAANSGFGSGSQIGTGNYVVAITNGSQGNQDSVTVANLEAGTTYFAVYEFNGSGGSENYLTSLKLTGSFYLEKDNGPYSLTFDGSGDYVLSSTSLGNFGAGNFTIELWAKTSTSSTVLLGKRYEGSHGSFFVFALDGSGKIGMELDQDVNGTNYSATFGNTSITDGNWHHVAFTRSGTTIIYYVDGIQDTSYTVNVASISNSTAFSIGVRSVDGSYVSGFFSGLMDDIRVWNVARTQSEIANNKDTELTGTESDLLAYWKFNEGAGGKIFDYTTNVYDGTFYGNTTWSSTVPSITPLPVELVLFGAFAQKDVVELQWKTATEANNHGFEVERMTPSQTLPLQGGGQGGGWVKIGFAEGSGTSNTPKEYSFTDKNLSAGKYLYRLKQIDRDGKFSYSQEVEVEVGIVPEVFMLEQNYPNPFNPATTIGFTLQHSGFTTLKIYDAIGREVATLVNEVKDPGSYQVKFDGLKLASGIYFSRLQSNEKVQIRKMQMLK
ncbi:MAG: fibronectin type III domain-containing protein [Ignavibacteriales bacterium]|nr:fibronectin type III domain-containing protein [Ignavibacteriales bacterium]